MKLPITFTAAIATLALPSLAQAQTVTAATGGETVCARHSSFTLAKGDSVEVNGAGTNSVSLLIKGTTGSWILFDGLVKAEDQPAASQRGTLVLSTDHTIAYRRSHNPKIYALVPSHPMPVDGQTVQVGVMGVDIIGQVLENAAIRGDDSDLAILSRVSPGVIGKCSYRWFPGKGLIRQHH